MYACSHVSGICNPGLSPPYPPQVALPGFTNKADAELWVRENYGYHMLGQTGANRRVLVDTRQGLLAFVGLRGQNVMYKNLRWGQSWGGALGGAVRGSRQRRDRVLCVGRPEAERGGRWCCVRIFEGWRDGYWPSAARRLVGADAPGLGDGCTDGNTGLWAA